MNHKLRNTILAFSVTGMVLAVGLIAARPALPGQFATAPAVADAPLANRSGAGALLANADAVSVRLQARGRQYEAALVDARSVEQAVALTVGFVTTVVGESLLVEPMDPMDADETRTADADADADTGNEMPVSQRRGRGVRSAIAVPYFSFARGMGRGRS